MDKGIRFGARQEFMRRLADRATIGNKAFRKAVIYALVEEYGCSVAAACTHYNFVFQECKKSNPELVEGLGRPPEKNNGGRKKKEVAPELVGPVQPTSTLISTGIKDNTATQTVGTNPPADVPEQTEFKVCKKADGTVIAEGLSFEDAKALVEKAAAAKKAKLYFV